MIIINVEFIFNFTFIILKLSIVFEFIQIVTVASALFAAVVVVVVVAGSVVDVPVLSACTYTIWVFFNIPTTISAGLLTTIAAVTIFPTLIFAIYFSIIILLLLWLWLGLLLRWWVRRLRIGFVSQAASKTIFGHFNVVCRCGVIYDIVAVVALVLWQCV